MSDPEIAAAVIGAVVTIVMGVVTELMRRSRRDMQDVLRELSPDSGQSMHDKISRIESSVDEIRQVQAAQGERISAVEARVQERRR